MRVACAEAGAEVVPVSRRLGLVVVAFVLAPGFALAAAGDPQYKPVPRDLRWAKAGVLHQADVPPVFRPDSRRYANVMLPRCPGYYTPDRSRVTGTGSADRFFRAGNAGIGSTVSLFVRQLDTEAWWRAVVTDRYITCLARQLAAHPGHGFTAKVVTARRVRMRLNFAQPSAEFQTIIRYSKGGRSQDAMWVAVFFKYSRAIAVVSDTNVVRPCGCAERLAQRVFARLARSDPH
jgi:hypothetical protein